MASLVLCFGLEKRLGLVEIIGSAGSLHAYAAYRAHISCFLVTADFWHVSLLCARLAIRAHLPVVADCDACAASNAIRVRLFYFDHFGFSWFADILTVSLKK